MLNIEHRKTAPFLELQGEYVCTTEICPNSKAPPVDIYYTNDGYYVGVYYDEARYYFYETEPKGVEELRLYLIFDGGKYFYSRFPGDVTTTPKGFFIDGGRTFLRSDARAYPAGVRNGKLVLL